MTNASSRPTAYRLQPTACPRGLTLIEMLIALAVTMVMMAAVVNLFANISGSIRNRRAVIEVSGELRQVRMRLARDLAGATCAAVPWQRPEENRGYIEIIEGEFSDSRPADDSDGDGVPDVIDPAVSDVPGSQRTIGGDSTMVTDGAALGDWDDVLAFTVRSEAEPFVAEIDGNTVESDLAEVVWYATQRAASGPQPDPTDGMRMVHRRVLLIAPWLGPWSGRFNGMENISVRQEGGQWIANTLGDLTKRENRVTRIDRKPAATFPFELTEKDLTGPGNSLMLNSALAFDVRVYDPGAPLLQASTGIVLEPSDAGWAKAARNSPTIVGYGAFVDLGWGFDSNANLIYNGSGAPILPIFHEQHRAGWHQYMQQVAAGRGYPAVYDTWSYHYENDAVDQYGDGKTDRGVNGLDDDNQNGVDDMGERETWPPYNVPLRGVKVLLRVYERDARQVRETSVTHSFGN